MLRAITLLAVFSSFAWSQNLPIRQATAAAILGPLPSFRNGYLCSLSMPSGTTLNVFTPDGQVLAIPTDRRNAMSFAVDSDGTLAIGWVELPKIGIDIRDLSGKLIRSIETGRYMPAHLSFSPDHSLWSFGWQRDATDPSQADKSDYLTLRRYSTDGKQAGSFLLRSLFPQGLEPGDGGGSNRISVTPDRIGIEAYAGKVGSEREWVELDLDGNVTGRWKLDGDFRGVLLTNDGQAYVGGSHPYDKPSGVLRLNRAKSRWEPVASPDLQRYGMLSPVEGDNLVYANWPDQVLHLSWFAQPGSPRAEAKAR